MEELLCLTRIFHSIQTLCSCFTYIKACMHNDLLLHLTYIPEVITAGWSLPVVTSSQYLDIHCPSQAVLFRRVERLFTPAKVWNSSSKQGPLPCPFTIYIIPSQPVLTPPPPAEAAHQAFHPALLLCSLDTDQFGSLLLALFSCLNPANTLIWDKETVSINNCEFRWTVFT